MDTTPTNQYLFDWKTFYEKKCCSKFPPQLCYPEFYALAMTAILNWYEFIITTTATTPKFFVDSISLLCLEYFKCIPNMIHLIFGPDSGICVLSVEEIHEIITNYVVELNVSDSSIFFLETILKDRSSVANYRTLLMNTTLEYYRVDTLTQLTANLKLKGVCMDCDHKITDLPPPSCHYLSYLSNCTPIPIRGPKRWGPMYWIIFHALAQNLKKRNTTTTTTADDDDDDLVKTVNAYVAILPFIVPCNQCRNHYYQLVRPGEIPDLTDIDSLISLYQRIHALVSLDVRGGHNIKGIRSSSSRYTHQSGANKIT